ncbi:MAG: hypothetical protein DRI54_02930 [Bacteroidetes bacterium]|nr:MAG: hypothetical protein DRI54_02930 [Bacteroidota bacterium]
MKTNYAYLLALLFLFSTSAVWSQNNDEAVTPCGTNEVMDQFILENPEMESIIRADQEELEEFTQQFINSKKDDDTLYVPVVFHIIHLNGPENISSDIVHESIARLNIDYMAMNADTANVIDPFKGLIPVTNIQFRLATKDPSGNCHSGITRTFSTETLIGDHATQLLIQWPRNKYLNVWVVRNIESGAAAYSRYPSAVNNNPSYDGIVNRYDYLGANERTLTHEVGHWINLRHVWGDSNEPALPSNCSEDDLVSDTPLCMGNSGGCNTSYESCGSLDNVQNYMNYASCSINFTQGQSDRMRAALTSSIAQRNNLWTGSNMAATGIDVDPTLCAADYYTERTTVCTGEEIEFLDDSYNGPIDSWLWEFEGGTPATSDLENPFVSYAEGGEYNVKLTVTQGGSTFWKENNDFIKVLPSGVAIPYNETFDEVDNFPNDDWFVSSIDNIEWEITDNAAAVGSKSAFLNNKNQSDGEIDELIYSTVDLSGLEAAEISFKFAYAKKYDDNTDVLKLGITRNCGDSWVIKKRLKATTGTLVTADNQLSEFIPSADEWGEVVVSLSTLYYIENFRYKFEMDNGGGNNVYVDDIKIYDPTIVGINEVNKASLHYNVYPNPVNDQLSVEFNLLERTSVLGEIFDVTGRKVETIFNSDYSLGTHLLDYNTSDLNSGVYFIKITLEGESFTKRVIKN